MRPKLVVFDCDGVLIDSEDIASAVVAANLTRLGWEMTPAESMVRFMGMNIANMEPVIEARLGRVLPDAWRSELAAEIIAALREGVGLVPGAREVLLGVSAMGVPWRVASNSSADEMAVKFARTGLDDLTAGRAHAAAAVGRPKPAPDVYLYAAAAEGVAPADCVVLEDSATGVAAAVAAGMVCYGFAPHSDGAALRAAGAVAVLKDLQEFLGVLV